MSGENTDAIVWGIAKALSGVLHHFVQKGEFMLERGHTNHCREESLSYESLKKLPSSALQSEDEEKRFLPINELNRVNHQGRNRYLNSGIMLAQEQRGVNSLQMKGSRKPGIYLLKI